MISLDTALELGQQRRALHEKRARSNRERTAARAAKQRASLSRIKTERGCERCGVRGLPPEAYDFHHRDPDRKAYTISEMGTRAWSLIRGEIAKCDVLCANCHRIVEVEARQVAS